jgi:hypothetical protein
VVRQGVVWVLAVVSCKLVLEVFGEVEEGNLVALTFPYEKRE